MENIPPNELNILLCRFFMDVRKKDGGVYEPGTLASLQRSIQRCLKDNNSNTNILKDQEFAKSKEVLTARKRDLVVNNAKGNRPQAPRELTKGEEDLLFQTGQFGEDDPKFSSAQFGGCGHYISVLDHEMRAGNFSGELLQ